MRKIIIEVPDDCIDCKHYKDYLGVGGTEYCKQFNKVIHDFEPCPSCIAAEVNNLFNKHLENVLKE